MQPLTAAMPFKAEGAAHVGGCRLAVWTAGDPESALCPCFFSKESLGAAGGQRELTRGGAPVRELLQESNNSLCQGAKLGLYPGGSGVPQVWFLLSFIL